LAGVLMADQIALNAACLWASRQGSKGEFK